MKKKKITNAESQTMLQSISPSNNSGRESGFNSEKSVTAKSCCAGARNATSTQLLNILGRMSI